jgi:RNA polymerase sigma factor (sigma-70 family)
MKNEALAAVATSDAEVIRHSLRDPEQFAVVFDRHAPRIHRYIARRAGRQVADDLVAETFLAAFAKRHGYDAGYPDAGPWLYGFATNPLGQHRREEVRRLRLGRAAIPELDVPGHADRVSADVTARSLRGALAGALAALPPGDRDVLLLIAWEQLSYEDAARALGIPVGTVRSRLHRVRTGLRSQLMKAGLTETVEEILSNE